MRGVYKRGRIWYIDYAVKGKRHQERVGPSKKMAENVLHKKKVEIAENRYLDIKRNEQVKFKNFAYQTYLELHSKPNKKSWKKSDVVYLKHLCSAFGERYLYEITAEEIERYKIERCKKVSSASVNRELACLKHMFTKAIEWKKVAENPAKKVKLFKEPKGRDRYLEKEEIPKLLEACSDWLRPFVTVALNTGMRKGEIRGLKWRDIDIQREIIYLLDTKNGERAELPMNSEVKKALIKVRKHPESPYIFCNRKGEPYGDTYIRKAFLTACKDAGITNFRFHDTRHSFASHLAMSGVGLKTVQELMRHKSIQMTLRYAHLSPNYKRRAVEIYVTATLQKPKKPEIEESPVSELSELAENKELILRAPGSAVRASDS